jgi:hypothetical protein
MSYLDVLPLARVLNYLRVDPDLEDDDNEIISMINGACRFVEKRTNHLFYPRDVIYTNKLSLHCISNGSDCNSFFDLRCISKRDNCNFKRWV